MAAEEFGDLPPIPRYLDTQRMIVIFEMDEFMVGTGVFIMIFFAGFATSTTTALIMPLALVGLIVSGLFVRKLKSRYPQGYIQHMLYRSGLMNPESQKKLTRKDLKEGNRILPTGYVTYFIH